MSDESKSRTLPSPRLLALIGGIVVISGLAGAGIAALLTGGEEPVEAPDTVISVTGQPALADARLSFVVDPFVTPAVETVPGLQPGDAPRPVGRVVGTDGKPGDIVLRELIVTASDRGSVADLLDRWGGEVVDDFEDDPLRAPDDPIDFLVRIDPARVALSRLTADLRAVEPEQEGRITVSSEEVLALLAAAASEAAADGLSISLNWVASPAGIEDATATEAPDVQPLNPFRWGYISSGSPQDIGVDAAWRLLHGAGKLDNRVRIMVIDGGFTANLDFPDALEIKEAEWGEENNLKCSGAPCPWHGTDVSIAALAQLDNEYGAVGPAGPIGELVAFGQFLDMWKTFRRAKEVVAEEDIDVVNMSFSWDVCCLKSATESAADKHFKDMRNAGAVLFAAAGNDGLDVDFETCVGNSCSEARLTIPCESALVICVGGMGWNTAFKAPGSNYGNKTGDKTVEVYGPYCVWTIKDPANAFSQNAVRTTCGTSFASPFVAGVAALVKAADPGLGPSEIWEILRDTAHEGGVGFDIVMTGHQRRINARGAVAAALGVEVAPPQVNIATPVNGAEFSVEEFLEFKGTATEFTGIALPLLWESSIDGPLSDQPTFDTVGSTPLTPGVHVITATATDITGTAGSSQVTIEVINEPPELSIASPLPNTKLFEGDGVELIGYSKDPDTFGPLADANVGWGVHRQPGGGGVFSGFGHKTSVPANNLTPGNYTVVFSGTDGGGTSFAVSSFTVIDVPAGESVPLLQIDTPESGESFGAGNGNPVKITFAGSAFDTKDGSLSGTRLRWTAISDRGTEIVLCRGSNFPEDPYAGLDGGTIGDLVLPGNQGPQTIQIARNCSSTTFDLGLDQDSVGSTTWAIKLEAIDSAGLVGSLSIPIEVYFVTG